MPETITTLEAFKQKIGTGKTVCVHVGAEWCPPSKDLNVELDALKEKQFKSTVEFVYIDAEKLPTVAEENNIESVPHILVYKGGSVKGRVYGGKIPEITELLEAITSFAFDASIPLNDRLKSLINKSDIMVFMTGTPTAPRCGFTRKLVSILDGVGAKYGHFDILTSDEICEGLKAYSNWPTYPQVYAKGQLVGGCDIITELKENGELEEALGLKK